MEAALGGAVRVDATLQAGRLDAQSVRDRATAMATRSLPARTHTFGSYASSSVFKAYVPVVVATPDYQGELPFDLVAVADGRQLRASLCTVKTVYRSPRKQNSWTQLSCKWRR